MRDAAVTDDAVLDGRLRLRQPGKGHRVGHDAILLAAATAAKKGEHAVDLGAGVGGAGLALASRVDGLRVTLVEIDPALAALAAENAARNRPGFPRERRDARRGGFGARFRGSRSQAGVGRSRADEFRHSTTPRGRNYRRMRAAGWRMPVQPACCRFGWPLRRGCCPRAGR